jgi:hypothetical protein
MRCSRGLTGWGRLGSARKTIEKIDDSFVKPNLDKCYTSCYNEYECQFQNEWNDMWKNASRVVLEETSEKAERRRKAVELEELGWERSMDEALDDALAGTFPASDPVALAVLQ